MSEPLDKSNSNRIDEVVLGKLQTKLGVKVLKDLS